VPATNPPPKSSYTQAEVIQIMRNEWPDELEEQALAIGYRESRYVPTADNKLCCYGLFQIYFTVHKSWLVWFGVDEAKDLFDPVINAKAVYHLYQRADNSFNPWKLQNGLGGKPACAHAVCAVGCRRICGRSSMDRASDYGSEGCGFESPQARQFEYGL
jgi:hypothetical protein